MAVNHDVCDVGCGSGKFCIGAGSGRIESREKPEEELKAWERDVRW